MGCVKLHILDEQYKSNELKVSYFKKELTLKNSAVKEQGATLYAYCLNNPINMDPTGMYPVYDPNGNFLGTDDRGIAGHALVIDNANNFTQGMTNSDVVKTLFAGEMGKEARAKMDSHFAGLSKRPDYDGFVTISEGIAWAKAHPGALENPTPDNTLYIDASKLNFGSLTTSDFANIGVSESQNLFNNSNY